MRKKLSEIKAKLKKHAPEIAIGGYVLLSTIGWAMAGYYSVKLQSAENRIEDLEYVDPNAWPTLRVPPEAMEDMNNGQEMTFRKYRPENNLDKVMIQATGEDTWGEDFDEKFNRGKTVNNDDILKEEIDA